MNLMTCRRLVAHDDEVIKDVPIGHGCEGRQIDHSLFTKWNMLWYVATQLQSSPIG